MSSDKKHALVFGASGISGWAIPNQTLAYPTPTTAMEEEGRGGRGGRGRRGRGRGRGRYEPLDQFARKNQGVWDRVVAEHGLKTGRLEAYGWAFLSFIMDRFDFDRQYDLAKMRAAGFDETADTVKGYTTAFDRMRAAKVIS